MIMSVFTLQEISCKIDVKEILTFSSANTDWRKITLLYYSLTSLVNYRFTNPFETFYEFTSTE